MYQPRDCSINRYYDPATDQFLSIDPDIATTNQPYAFTNDDPLNASDPLGMEALKSVLLQNEAAAKRCKDQPEDNGCRGINVLKDIGTFVKSKVGVIGSGIAVAGLFVPGVDIIDVAALTTIGVASRVAQRSINNGTSPLSSKNLGANLLDVFISGVSLGLVGATSSAAEGIFSDMSPASAALLRARLSLPDIIEFIVDNSGGRGH
jgi:uncharacterized protein RhaS with RHS repeats